MKKWNVVNYYYNIGGEKEDIIEKMKEEDIGILENGIVQIDNGNCFVRIESGDSDIEEIKLLKNLIGEAFERKGFNFILCQIKKTGKKQFRG